MTILPQSSRCPSSWGISGSNAKLKEQTYSRPAVPLPSPPLSGGSLGEFRAHLGPSGLQLSRSLPSWWRDACGQPRTVAICKEGQSQAQYSSLTARKLWAWALAPRPTFPGVFLVLSHSLSPQERPDVQVKSPSQGRGQECLGINPTLG